MSQKLVKYVKIDEFVEDSITLVPYDASYAKGDIKEILTRYMTKFSEQEPEVKEHMSDGVHNVEDCIKYVRDKARKLAVENCAAVDSDLVFKWAVNYYRSCVGEKLEEEKPEYKPSAEIEALQKKRAEEEAKRKAEEEEKKRKAEIEKNGLSLFDQLFQ